MKVGRCATKRNNKVIRTEVSERHRWRKRVQNWRENRVKESVIKLEESEKF